VNKIDRRGAGHDRVLEAISGRLAAAIVPMGFVDRLGTRAAQFTPGGEDDVAFRTRLTEVLAGQNDSLLAAYVEDEAGVTYRRLREELVAQTRRAVVHPVFFGSAITGAGVEPLIFIAVMVGLLWLLIIRPQRRRQAKHVAMMGDLSLDDEIVTAGGLYGRIQRLDGAARVHQIHHAAVDERRCLVRAFAHGPRPRELQLTDVVASDLTQRAVAPAVERTAPVEPIIGIRVAQRGIGDGREVSEPWTLRRDRHEHERAEHQSSEYPKNQPKARP